MTIVNDLKDELRRCQLAFSQNPTVSLAVAMKQIKQQLDALRQWRLIWSPTGQEIAVVQARTQRAAIRRAPKPYRKYLGEVYAEEV